MSETVSGAELRQNMRELLDGVERTHQRVVVTRNGKPSAVIISADDLESLEETIAVLSDPELMSTIRESEADLEAGRSRPFEEFVADQAARRARTDTAAQRPAKHR